MASQSADVVIIGAGVAGLVAAHECLEKGHSVTLIERHDETRVGFASTERALWALLDHSELANAGRYARRIWCEVPAA